MKQLAGFIVSCTLFLSACTFPIHGGYLYGKGKSDFTFHPSQPIYVALSETATTNDTAFQALLVGEMKRLGFNVIPQLSQEALVLFFAMNSNSNLILAPLPGNVAISRLPEQWHEVSLELFSLNHIDTHGPVWIGHLRVKRKEFDTNPAGALTPLLELVGKNYEGPISVSVFSNSQPGTDPVKMTQEQHAKMQNLERRIEQLEREEKKAGDTTPGLASQAKVGSIVFELTEACHNGTMQACISLAELYLKGGEIPADPQRAAQLYEEACSGQNGKACTNLGLLHYQGIGVTKDFSRAKELFRQGCHLNDKLGCILPEGIN